MLRFDEIFFQSKEVIYGERMQEKKLYGNNLFKNILHNISNPYFSSYFFFGYKKRSKGKKMEPFDTQTFFC